MYFITKLISENQTYSRKYPTVRNVYQKTKCMIENKPQFEIRTYITELRTLNKIYKTWNKPYNTFYKLPEIHYLSEHKQVYQF